MSDPSPVPAPGLAPTRRSAAKTAVSKPSEPRISSIEPAAPRKLIRPTLPADILRRGGFPRLSPVVSNLAHTVPRSPANDGQDDSHAEAFYLQKQAQSQTLMVFVLEDGEHIEGYIEWYDRNVIKVRHGGRTLIYKSGIKYIYKAGENSHG